MPNKRSQPVAAPAPNSRTTSKSKTTTSSSRSAGNHHALPSSTSPDTPALTPASSSTDESSSTNARVVPLSRISKKKLIKTVRTGNGGHGHGNGGHGGHGNSTKGTMKTRRAAVGGPEAELSGDDDDDDEECDEESTSSEEDNANVNVVGESPPGERVIQGVEGKSAPKSEVSMHTLLDGAKLRPQSQNISRGYELLTSPASRMVIPFDSINSRGKLHKANPSDEVRPASPGFSDDVEWEWEDLCFEMDGLGLSNPGKKSAYADVVKRAA